MQYPKFIKKDSTIGIVAMSSGVGNRIDDYLKSISTFKDRGYKIVESDSVRNTGIASNSGEARARELDNLVNNKDVDLIINAAGGDFCLESISYINFENFAKNRKWIMGASDPTSILYILTTGYDVATIYGFNSTSFDDRPLHLCQENAIKILEGNVVLQKNFEKFESNPFANDTRVLDAIVKWNSLNGDFKVSGRIIGGCIDVLRNLLGTPYDYTNKFIEKYKDEGIIWYFDNFSLSVEEFYLTLLQMQMAGWFKYTKAVVLGRVCFPKSFNDNFQYSDALKKIFKNIPLVTDACIGHIFPKIVIINGSYSTIEVSNNSGIINLELK